MKGKRRFMRFQTELKAQCSVQGGKDDWEECTVISMGRKGVGVRFHSRQKVHIGSPIRLRIFVPEKMRPTIVEGVLKWTEERENVLFGGIECDELLDEMQFSKQA